MTFQALAATDDNAAADTAAPRLPTTDDADDQPLVPAAAVVEPLDAPPEIGGRTGPNPTRYGDWELRGRCIDF